MTIYSIDIDRLVSLRIVVLSLIVFMLNNLLGIGILALYIVVNKSEDKSEYIMLFCLLALFIGMINAGKLLESDLAGYSQLFTKSGEISFWDFMIVKVKEPVFWIFTYIIYYLTAGNFSIYVLICSFIIYFLLYYSLYKFYLHVKRPELVLYAVFCITFFSPFFGLSAHILRQVMATSLLLYFIVDYIFYDRNRYWILLLAVFIHSSVWFFVPLIFMRFFKKRITVTKLLVSIPIVFVVGKFYVEIFSFLTRITSAIPPISYVFSRLTGEIVEKDAGVGLIAFLLVVLLVAVSVYVLYFKRIEDKKLIHLYNIFLMLVFFIVLTQEQSLLSMRFYFFSYSFLPFILFYPFNVKDRLSHLLLFVGIALLVVKFVMFIEHGEWEYDSIGDIMRYDIVDFLKKI